MEGLLFHSESCEIYISVAQTESLIEQVGSHKKKGPTACRFFEKEIKHKTYTLPVLKKKRIPSLYLSGLW